MARKRKRAAQAKPWQSILCGLLVLALGIYFLWETPRTWGVTAENIERKAFVIESLEMDETGRRNTRDVLHLRGADVRGDISEKYLSDELFVKVAAQLAPGNEVTAGLLKSGEIVYLEKEGQVLLDFETCIPVLKRVTAFESAGALLLSVFGAAGTISGMAALAGKRRRRR